MRGRIPERIEFILPEVPKLRELTSFLSALHRTRHRSAENSLARTGIECKCTRRKEYRWGRTARTMAFGNGDLARAQRSNMMANWHVLAPRPDAIPARNRKSRIRTGHGEGKKKKRKKKRGMFAGKNFLFPFTRSAARACVLVTQERQHRGFPSRVSSRLCIACAIRYLATDYRLHASRRSSRTRQEISPRGGTLARAIWSGRSEFRTNSFRIAVDRVVLDPRAHARMNSDALARSCRPQSYSSRPRLIGAFLSDAPG